VEAKSEYKFVLFFSFDSTFTPIFSVSILTGALWP
jgi:hypothetical protein